MERSPKTVLKAAGLTFIYVVVPLSFSFFSALSVAPPAQDRGGFLIQSYLLRWLDHLVLLIVLPIVSLLVAVVARRLRAGWLPLTGSATTGALWWLAAGPISPLEIVESLFLQAIVYWAILTSGERGPSGNVGGRDGEP